MQKLKQTRRKHNKQHKTKHNNKIITRINTYKQNTELLYIQRINRTKYSRRFVGWIYCIHVVFCVSSSVYVVCYVYLCLCLMFSPSIFKLLHLRSNDTHKHIKQNITTLRTTEQHKTKPTQTETSQPEPERYLFVVGSWAGYPVFLFVLLFLELFCLLFCFILLLFLCPPSFVKLLHLQSTKHKDNNITTLRKAENS